MLFKKICVFFMLSKILIQLCPNEKYEKYLDTLVEWVFLTLLIAPIFMGGKYIKNCETFTDLFAMFDEYMDKENMGWESSQMLEKDRWQKDVLEIYEKAAKEEVKLMEPETQTEAETDAETDTETENSLQLGTKQNKDVRLEIDKNFGTELQTDMETEKGVQTEID